MGENNIILVGFMGSGKTTIGRKLAKKLIKYRFIDMDDEIEKKTGMKISFIFERFGEKEFRTIESNLCKELSNISSCVIATGGGVIKNQKNMELLKTNGGVIIYLKATPEHIYRNIKNDVSRPLLQCDDKLGKINKLLDERKTLYESQCDITVDVSGLNAKEAAEMIISAIEGDKIL